MSFKSKEVLRPKMLRITALINWLKKYITSPRGASIYYAIPYAHI